VHASRCPLLVPAASSIQHNPVLSKQPNTCNCLACTGLQCSARTHGQISANRHTLGAMRGGGGGGGEGAEADVKGSPPYSCQSMAYLPGRDESGDGGSGGGSAGKGGGSAGKEPKYPTDDSLNGALLSILFTLRKRVAAGGAGGWASNNPTKRTAIVVGG
jgi:hypothetical protein